MPHCWAINIGQIPYHFAINTILIKVILVQIALTWAQIRDGFSYFRSRGWINIWGGGGVLLLALAGKAKGKV